jgi:hypothetical protein
MLDGKLMQLVTDAARILDKNRMARFNPQSGNLAVTDMGRTCRWVGCGERRMSLHRTVCLFVFLVGDGWWVHEVVS